MDHLSLVQARLHVEWWDENSMVNVSFFAVTALPPVQAAYIYLVRRSGNTCSQPSHHEETKRNIAQLPTITTSQTANRRRNIASNMILRAKYLLQMIILRYGGEA